MLKRLIFIAAVRAHVVHELFDSAYRPELPSLPLVYDDSTTQELRLWEGDDVAASLAAAGPQTSAPYVDRVVRAAYARAHAANRTLRRRWAIVVASPSARITRRSAAKALWASALSACAHAASVVVVADGFSISRNDRAALAIALNASGCVRASLVVLREWAGPAAAYAAGAASVTDERAMLVFVPWGVLLAEDAFVAYERMLRGYGDSVVAYAPVRGNGASRLPLVAVEASTWRISRKPDVGYVLEGGVAAWLAALEDAGDAVEARWRVDTTSPEEGPVLLDLDWERLIQRDADQFHLARREIGEPPSQGRQAWLRGPSAISVQRHARENRGEGTVAASLCVYDDDRFLESLVEDLLPRLRHLIISHATAPWFGTARPAGFLRASQSIERIRSNAPDKVRVVHGAWPSEEAQRNAALQLAATLVPRPTHLLLVDGDEFWHPVELDRALALVYQASQQRRISWVRATMATYFKTARFVVDPPEPLKILWLVEVPPENTAVTCGFSEARNWACSSSDASIDLAATIEALGTFVDPTTAKCHHLSYVRTTEELHDKLTSFAHARDVRENWLRDVWHAWDFNRSLEDLHPTHPSAFKRTVLQELHEMPPALRRLAEPTGDPSLLELGPPPPLVEHPVRTELKNNTEEETDLQWKTLAPGHFESVLTAAELQRRPKLQIDASPELPRCDSAGAPRFVVLVLGEGELDDSTEGVFADAAEAVADALRELGVSQVSVVYCADARLCKAPRDAPFFTVVLGAHHLARYRFDDHGVSRTLCEAQGWPAPDASVLYNFETVNEPTLLQDIFPRWALKKHLWDYSSASVLKLARLKIDARHVPLGWSSSLERYAPPDDVDRDLGVVFVGRMNGRRKKVLEELRKRGVPVFHANADALLFGDGLRDVLRRARIVLSLSYFGDADEWKATRYLPSIAAGAVVVAEAGGARLEREAWRETVIFVEGVEAMVDVVKFYASNETARAERARRAAAVLKARRFAAALRGPVEDLVLGSCRFWRAAADVGDAEAWRWRVAASSSSPKGEL